MQRLHPRFFMPIALKINQNQRNKMKGNERKSNKMKYNERK